ncbi:MAG: DNA methylase [Salinivirgaceae bacterium]|nr:DNA methylase [Salinivirgaceae bacterium]
MDLSKYVKGETTTLLRSQIRIADYNPRVISEEGRKSLKRIIKKYGLIGGIVVNRKNHNTLVSGHQRLSVMDELQKYDPATKDNDYSLKVELIDVDEKTEKELNIAMNNPNAQGTWDMDKLAQIVPDIDYKDVGLTDSDLSIIGLDWLYKTEEENNILSDLGDLYSPLQDAHDEELAERQAEREQQRQIEAEIDRAERVQAMKDLKAKVKEDAIAAADKDMSYVCLSFDNSAAMDEFLTFIGFEPGSRFLKGEEVLARLNGDDE